MAGEPHVPENVKAYIAEFDEQLTEEEFNSPQFSYRLLFTRKLTGKPGQADKIIEFIDPHSEMAKTIDREYWVQKEVERPKFLPKQIVALMRSEGFSGFSMYHHTKFWQSRDAKNPGRGYGVEIAGGWYWYERWVAEVRKHCQENRDRFVH